MKLSREGSVGAIESAWWSIAKSELIGLSDCGLGKSRRSKASSQLDWLIGWRPLVKRLASEHTLLQTALRCAPMQTTEVSAEIANTRQLLDRTVEVAPALLRRKLLRVKIAMTAITTAATTASGRSVRPSHDRSRGSARFQAPVQTTSPAAAPNPSSAPLRPTRHKARSKSPRSIAPLRTCLRRNGEPFSSRNRKSQNQPICELGRNLWMRGVPTGARFIVSHTHVTSIRDLQRALWQRKRL